MINNRQGGRRRGRGGQRPQSPSGRPDGNRQDNRQRGNAAQLLEKYKSMARDAQLGGDRVQTEYYLQYADHYFRVLGESRSRFDEQRPRRDDDDEDEDGEEMLDGDGDQGSEQGNRDDGRDDRPQRDERPQRNDRQDRPERSERPERVERAERIERPERVERPEQAERAERVERPERAERPVRAERPERSERPRRYARDDRNGEEVGPGIALEAIPPAIGIGSSGDDAVEAEVSPKPRRRAVRRPRSDEDGDIAPVV